MIIVPFKRECQDIVAIQLILDTAAIHRLVVTLVILEFQVILVTPVKVGIQHTQVTQILVVILVTQV